MPFDLGALIEQIKSLWPGAAGGAIGVGALRFLFKTPPTKDLRPCHTLIHRGGAAWPWDKYVVIHCTKKGQIHMKLVEPNEK